MTKYLFKRLLHGLVSVVIVVGCVMTMIYSLMDRNLIFAQDATYSHQSNNQKKVYKYQKWETYGYLDYPMRRKTPCFSYGDIRRVHRIYASN